MLDCGFAFATNSDGKKITTNEVKKIVVYEPEYDCIVIVNKCGMMVGDYWPKGSDRKTKDAAADADSFCN